MIIPVWGIRMYKHRAVKQLYILVSSTVGPTLGSGNQEYMLIFLTLRPISIEELLSLLWHLL